MTSNSLPLSGIKVIDLSRVLAGPFCSMLLSHLGAEVIKIEDRKGDETRAWPPFTGDMSDSFLAVNLNKRGIVIDLARPEGQQIVHVFNKMDRTPDAEAFAARVRSQFERAVCVSAVRGDVDELKAQFPILIDAMRGTRRAVG